MDYRDREFRNFAYTKIESFYFDLDPKMANGPIRFIGAGIPIRYLPTYTRIVPFFPHMLAIYGGSPKKTRSVQRGVVGHQ